VPDRTWKPTLWERWRDLYPIESAIPLRGRGGGTYVRSNMRPRSVGEVAGPFPDLLATPLLGRAPGPPIDGPLRLAATSPGPPIETAAPSPPPVSLRGSLGGVFVGIL